MALPLTCVLLGRLLDEEQVGLELGDLRYVLPLLSQRCCVKVIVCSREEWEKLKRLLIFSPCSSIVLIRYFCFSPLLSRSHSLLPLIFVGVFPPLFSFVGFPFMLTIIHVY